VNYEINIKVYNLLGELMLNTKTNNNQNQIDLNHQPNGIDFIRETIMVNRLIKQ
jgi:hypothetical protein